MYVLLILINKRKTFSETNCFYSCRATRHDFLKYEAYIINSTLQSVRIIQFFLLSKSWNYFFYASSLEDAKSFSVVYSFSLYYFSYHLSLSKPYFFYQFFSEDFVIQFLWIIFNCNQICSVLSPILYLLYIQEFQNNTLATSDDETAIFWLYIEILMEQQKNYKDES